MISIDIPGYKDLGFTDLVLDYNGTIAFDGELIPGVRALLEQLAGKVSIHVLTADTFGTAQDKLKDLECRVHLLSPENQDQGKLDYIRSLGEEKTLCIGNGRNDRLMLRHAGLGIALIQGEGASLQTIQDADIVCTSITDALGLIENPLRMKATLRS